MLQPASMTPMQRDSMQYDVLIVGGGPAGLSAAIRLAQCAADAGRTLSICVIEKGAEIGAHSLSGAVLEPRALNELLPDWAERGAPLTTKAGKDRFLLLSKNGHIQLPTPPQMRNHGNYIVSLGLFCRWLGEQAQSLGVDIFPGFPASQLLMGENGDVQGVITGDMGVGRDGEPKPGFQPGVELRATYTLFAEGSRGHLSQQLMERFSLRQGVDPQTYGIGIKEVWEIDPAKHQAGSVLHTVGWPMPSDTYGGSFCYHWGGNLLSIGFVVGLDYTNPHLDPFAEFQRFKHHTSIAPLLEGGRRIAYGARALNEGGYQSIPKLIFPGGALIGCAAGFLNVPKIKGTHTAMKSGMVAAESVFAALQGDAPPLLETYPKALEASWVYEELRSVRNIRPGFRKGLWWGLLHAALDTYLFRGKAPWTLRNHADHTTLKRAKDCAPIAYPKPDGVLSFDRLSSVYLSNTNHEEDQPVHLTLKDASVPIRHNLALYDAPEQRYCPAGVYEIVRPEGAEPHLQINAQNCVHCKTCDIKDPTQNIRWVTPEGGGGPVYGMM